jgi:two-component system OmpR family response regulator
MRILVIEDDQKIARYIAKGLRREDHHVELSANGREGLSAALRPPLFDVIVLDLMLPKLDGFAILGELRKREMPIPVLMLSARDSVDDRVRGLRSGADDYLVKPFSMEELSARVESLGRRGRAAGAEQRLLTVADLTLDRLSRQVRRGGEPLELQPREFAMLEYFMCNVGRVLTKSMILEHVWRWKFDPQTNVVDVLVFRLRNKVDRGAGPRLIHNIRGVGYVCRVE